jgi:hypothetical protein
MILNNEQVKQIQNANGGYTGFFLQQSFGYRYLQAEVSAVGNAIVFESPINMGVLNLPNSLAICAEILNTGSFAGICFARLYMMQVGTILSQLTKKDWYLNGDCLFMEDKQASLCFVNEVKNTALIHVLFSREDNQLGLQPLLMSDEDMSIVKTQAISVFNLLVKDVYIQTRRDNF